MFGRSRIALRVFDTEVEAKNFFRYCQTEFIRYTMLLTNETLTSFAKKVPDILDYSDDNGYIDFSGDVNAQLYKLFGIDEETQTYIRSILATKAE